MVNLVGPSAGAEDVFMEFDFQWKGKQNISLSFNPAPKILQSIPGIKQIVDYALSWSVSALTSSLCIVCVSKLTVQESGMGVGFCATCNDQLLLFSARCVIILMASLCPACNLAAAPFSSLDESSA